ncbi:MAG: hypothetical protein K2X69_08325 [Silvanigrellaceae bacterium]|nr:hypothetical protein [Silvanigrellaceae bacterium]
MSFISEENNEDLFDIDFSFTSVENLKTSDAALSIFCDLSQYISECMCQ